MRNGLKKKKGTIYCTPQSVQHHKRYQIIYKNKMLSVVCSSKTSCRKYHLPRFCVHHHPFPLQLFFFSFSQIPHPSFPSSLSCYYYYCCHFLYYSTLFSPAVFVPVDLQISKFTC
uniref:Uncharacterized protein n=1 Tax=Trypanosoma vivax (strain Y486) TaxID=1055687 RepID=G0U0R1_TRYVY|nr:hypothetical protein TVY486_0802690 [Trypanosoma vivax Y486]